MIQSLLQPRTTLSEQSLSPLGRRGARDLRLLAGAGGYLGGLAVEDYFRLFEIASGVWRYVNTSFNYGVFGGEDDDVVWDVMETWRDMVGKGVLPSSIRTRLR
jgi:hypothetical protein